MPAADARAAAVAYLAADDAMRADLPAHPADGLANVSADPAAPWPCLQVLETPAGSGRNLRWATDVELQLQVWGLPPDEPGDQVPEPELRRLLVLALDRLRAACEEQLVVAGVVLSALTSTVPPFALPDRGQPRYLSTVVVTVHPALAG